MCYDCSRLRFQKDTTMSKSKMNARAGRRVFKIARPENIEKRTNVWTWTQEVPDMNLRNPL